MWNKYPLKEEYKLKVWFNWRHMVLLGVGILTLIYSFGKRCIGSENSFFTCISERLSSMPTSVKTFVLIGIIVATIGAYLWITFHSWNYYRSKS